MCFRAHKHRRRVVVQMSVILMVLAIEGLCIGMEDIRLKSIEEGAQMLTFVVIEEGLAWRWTWRDKGG